MTLDELTEAIIGAATEVHRILGPGLLESSYINCWCREFQRCSIPFERDIVLAETEQGASVECGYKIDILVDNQVVLAIKAVENMDRIHEAQLLAYLRLGGWKEGLVLNFNIPVLKNGVKRCVYNFEI